MIAVTGANGLLGSFITKELLAHHPQVQAIVRPEADLQLLQSVNEKLTFQQADVTDLPSLHQALAGADTVVHVAGVVSFNRAHRERIYQVNVEGTRNVIDCCLKLGVKNVIHVSSVAALGRSKESKHVDETSRWVASHLNTDYAESKHLAELEVYRGMEEGLQVSMVNPSVILAPVHSGQSSAQLFSYVAKGWPFYGDGTMNFVDVRDVAHLVARLVQQPRNGERYIANAGAASLKQILDGIATRLNKSKPYLRIPGGWVAVAALLEETRAKLASKEPMLTRQSVKLLKENFFFSNQKAIHELGIQFRTLDDTLDWCCAALIPAKN